MKVCVITDNLYIFEEFSRLLEDRNVRFDFFYSPRNKAFRERFGGQGNIRPLELKAQSAEFFDGYDLFFSLHCKQLFPEYMVEHCRCINVHPGYNPYNRGWFPQVFGILNKKPIGVTIHRIDRELDHGPILFQRKLELRSEDTSKDIYNRILAAEIDLLREHLDEILAGTCPETPMAEEGNINYKADFDALCRLDLDETATYGQVIDRLRALTFAPYDNAYFVDQDGKKVYVGITLKKEN